MNRTDAEIASLREQVAALQLRLGEAEDTLAAIQSGDVDALVVGDDIYTLTSASAAENRLRQDVLAQMEDAVLAFDPDGHLIYMNAAAERQYGASNSQMLGRPRQALFRESWPGAGHEAAALDSLRQTGFYRAHSMHARNDGTTIHVESTVSRLRTEKGPDIGLLCVVRDITWRVQADQALRETSATLAFRERQFSTLMSNSPDILVRFDLAGRYLYVSPAIERYTGLAPESYIGGTNAELGMPDELCAHWKSLLESTVNGATLVRTSFAFRTPDSVLRHFDARLMPEFGDDAQVVSVLVIAVDTTEQARADIARREAEAALRVADRRKDEFLATLAHELRNPLAPIRNGTQVLRLTGGVGMAAQRALTVVERQVAHMVRLVDDLMDISRITQGKLELRRQPVQLAEVVDSALESCRPLIEEMGHALSVVCHDDSIVVDADLTRLAQVLINLLNNAAKYMECGGSIVLTVDRQDSEATVSIRDTGAGIPHDQLSEIFEMFTQQERTPHQARSGLGIGLALARQLAEMHGGRIEVISDGPGTGSEFVLRLQVAAPPAASLPEPAEILAPPATAAPTRILVVDDNQDGADTLAETLALVGHVARTAYDGAQALALADTFRPQVVLLDLGMPVLDGFEVCRRLRRLDWTDTVVLIALTGWGSDEDRRRTQEAGFDHHLVKPVAAQQVEQLLARSTIRHSPQLMIRNE